MKNLLFLGFAFLLFSVAIVPTNTTSLSGKITALNSGEKILFASIVLYKEGKLIRGIESDLEGIYHFQNIEPGIYNLEVSYIGFQTIRIDSIHVIQDKVTTVDVEMKEERVILEEVVVTAYKKTLIRSCTSASHSQSIVNTPTRNTASLASIVFDEYNEYDERIENVYKTTRGNRFSTFGIDVDRASYSITRQYLNNDELPPKDAVRTEELINYFSYNYAPPKDQHPFAVYSEWSSCPWEKDHLLLSVALQGENKAIENAPHSNLTFLLDVSGSMSATNKLPLVKSSMRILLDQLRPEDKVSIVVYAQASGLVLPPTAVANKEIILSAMDKLRSGGSTAGGAGIKLAYKTAREQFVEGGNNRIILATDGDFNVGVSHVDSLEALIEKEKESGVFLTVLGFGMGNLKDNRMERLADKGNGMYCYIDTESEARKVFELELTSSLYTIAKDVKLQLRFNPKEISEYRLIGYENRLLNEEDFEDDTKDAGELGAGHSVTALYEVIPRRALKKPVTLQLRYKRPNEKSSHLLEHVVNNRVRSFGQASNNLRWAAAVSAYSMIITDSPFKGDTDFESTYQWALNAIGLDPYGFRQEFVNQIKRTEDLTLNLETLD